MKKRIWNAVLCAVLVLSLTVPAAAAYRDVPVGHWAAEDIRYVSERGLFKGTGSDTFGPSEKMNRAMLATVLYRYAGSPAVNGAAPYADVTAGAWYMPGVIWAYQNQIFPSVTLSKTMLYPTEDVRRAEFCIMLYRFAQSLGKANADLTAVERAPFTDVEWNRFSMAGFGPIYNESREAMLGWAWPMEIMNGTTDTTINPLGTITRAEVAAMLARFDKKVLGGTEVTAQQPSPDLKPNPTTTFGDTTDSLIGITEESVLAILESLEARYPNNTPWPAPHRSTSGGPYGAAPSNCAGWATLCSDAAFGSLPWRRINAPSWAQLRVGDLVQYNNEGGSHVVVVVEKTDEYIIATESTTTQKAYWGAQYFRWWLEDQSGLILYTRYPE